MITYTVRVETNGTQWWLLNDNLHREDGPAVVGFGGSNYWYLHGKLHRLDGPAVEYANGAKCWYINGVILDEDQFIEATKSKVKENCEGKVVEVEGVKYRLVKA